ncbi:hypothetical protein K3U93_05255 [Mycobacterium malmoense]|uniref:PE-PGRS family protein n=1 Tax=Mycobacterium malmoense TaxID=1780 RepID=A0ABX3SNA7_MYCMA|nr:hypothetical protein [Mycobacterium malmoense]ORA79618.1 hypothetical protein BST29_18725 [Mycobacterium malmoense]QZA18600.1 hypothetical protein K3U93_05255 [Mycobacterium malmoense]UNB95372.1 hypothetical protein H5T25_05250 [Mycobacterium malmoense]
MQQLAAFRPLITAGAAAVGASLIALTPAVLNDVASDLQRSAVTIEHHAVQLLSSDPGVVNPIQTWTDALQLAGTNLQSLYEQWSQIPFLVPQQVAANGVQYASDYVGAYQTAATGLVNTFGPGGTAWPLVQSGLDNIFAGNITAGMQDIFGILSDQIVFGILEPLEGILNIPRYGLDNLTTAYSYLLIPPSLLDPSVLIYLGDDLTEKLPDAIVYGTGTGLQDALEAARAGDLAGAVTNLLNIPGLQFNTLFNGYTQSRFQPIDSGILTTPQLAGWIQQFLGVWRTPFAKALVAPGSQNIAAGGSLATAVSDFINQLFTQWPVVGAFFQPFFNGSDAAGAAAFSGGSAMASLPTELPGLSADVLKAFDPAAVTNIAASLGPSLAADVAGSLGSSLGSNIAGSLATTLSVELPTLALHILSAL